MRKIIIILFLFISLGCIAYSQKATVKIKPVSFGFDTSSKMITSEAKINSVKMKEVNADSLKEAEEKEKSNQKITNDILKFGFSHFVNLDILKEGTWDTLDNGARLCRLRINCPKAYSINLIFDKFYLIGKSILFIFNN